MIFISECKYDFQCREGFLCLHGGCVENPECTTDHDCNSHPIFKSLANNYTCAKDIQTEQMNCFKSCSDKSECGVHQICLKSVDQEVAKIDFSFLISCQISSSLNI